MPVLLRFLRCLVAGVSVCALRVPANAVFPDAPTQDFSSVGMIGKKVDGAFKMSGCGVAISPGWVVGVSHVGGDRFVQDGREYQIEKKVAFTAERGEPADLALFKLAKPAASYSSILLADFDGPVGKRLKGEVVFLVGFGKTAGLRQDGLGWQPIEGTQGTRRAAKNTIDFAELNRYDLGKGGVPKWRSTYCLAYDLDNPANRSQSVFGGGAVDGEGGVADKDSGGGWFVHRGGKMQLVAISCTVGRVRSTMPTAYCYGGVGFGVHLLPYAGWIRSVTGLKI